MTLSEKKLLDAWFPARGFEKTRPQAVSDHLTIVRDPASGMLEVRRTVVWNGHNYAFRGRGFTGEEAILDWCTRAELWWSSRLPLPEFAVNGDE